MLGPGGACEGRERGDGEIHGQSLALCRQALSDKLSKFGSIESLLQSHMIYQVHSRVDRFHI